VQRFPTQPAWALVREITKEAKWDSE
jgi:hypothetical protein